MIRVYRNFFWSWGLDKPGPERREAYGAWLEINLGPFQIYWEAS